VERDAVDRRTRVLVVEDIDTLRDSYVLNLELEKRYRVDSAADLLEATAAVASCTYHVALVDIMLAGEKDVANRDGVKVLERIRELNEGTKPIVLSIQPHPQLVADLLQDYGAYGYLDKDAVRQGGGFGKVVALVDKATDASPVGIVPTWNAVVQNLLAGQADEGTFVSEAMDRLQFKGGFENLRETLVSAMRYFLPLLPPTKDRGGLAYDVDNGAFGGRFWSKGQGCAVEVALTGGQQASAEAIGGQHSGGVLLAQEKAQLAIRVEQLPQAARQEFLASSSSGSGSASR
jgi:CheY-like chemotaxis protein